MTSRKPAPPTVASMAELAGGAAPPGLAERLTFLVHTASARIASIGNQHFREHDLNHFSARILVMLLEHEELRTGDLVERMVLPQSTISSQLQVLHKKRLVRRRRSRQDNRSVIVSLTPAGQKLARDCNQLSLRVHEAVIRDISAAERKSGFAFLRKINERLMALEQQDLVPFHAVAQLQALADVPDTEAKSRKAKSVAARRA